ncbi:unnamed protein product [Clonostachys rosea]|uniref:Origin recognition complex subunit 2 n=1 Tax=Bionectria ochroleuca TaxID=29856 RepID=A0ABY6TX05_BIOOC|nr:unnamed protein product [Clonostachys rosea]
MPPKKVNAEGSPAEDQSRLRRKRSHLEVEASPEDVDATAPAKRRRGSVNSLHQNVESGASESINGTSNQNGTSDSGEHSEPGLEIAPQEPTTTPRKRGRPPKAASQGNTPTPKAKRQRAFQTPTKGLVADDSTPRRQAGADRSARRKSARALIEQVVGDGDSDDQDDEDALAREIYESSEGEADDEIFQSAKSSKEQAGEDGLAGSATEQPAVTPTKRRARKKARSPTPPRDLPPHELYFAQNKPGRPKTSNNTLASVDLLTHDEYFKILNEREEKHHGDIQYLESLHAESFPQWAFELAEGFSLCLYGYGSKRHLLQKFAKHLHSSSSKGKLRKIVMVNGYASTMTMREILSTVAVAVDPKRRIPTTQPAAMVQNILAHLSTTNIVLTIIVNSIDAVPLRKLGHQSVLAQLASHPQVGLACSADTPDFSLLWDIGLRSAFNFTFHDCTTFSPFTVELNVVDDVHELLGRKAHRVNGREGVAFVLRSLPDNAKNLFQLIVGEILIAMEEEASDGDEVGVEYRMLYNKSVEEFICSSEMAFRTLLKEFHDHQIITSRKDALGTELLSVPFRKDELEAILEDLTA